MAETLVTPETALRVVALFARIYTDRTGQAMPTGMNAYRSGTGPVLMVPDAQAAVADGRQVFACDTTGNGNPAVVMEAATGICRCCEGLVGCWAAAVQEAANAEGLGVYLEAYARWAISLYVA